MVTNKLCTAVLAHHTGERAQLLMKLKKAAQEQDVMYLMYASMYSLGGLNIECDSNSGYPSVISSSKYKLLVANSSDGTSWHSATRTDIQNWLKIKICTTLLLVVTHLFLLTDVHFHTGCASDWSTWAVLGLVFFQLALLLCSLAQRALFSGELALRQMRLLKRRIIQFVNIFCELFVVIQICVIFWLSTVIFGNSGNSRKV